jgi:hypothetical protein
MYGEPFPMNFLDDLRAEKQAGKQEWDNKQAEERQREADEAARLRAEEEAQRSAEADRDRKKAEEAYAVLPKIVREAAAKGLKTAVLSNSAVEEHVDGEKAAVAIQIDRRKFYLTGWQIPFYQLCRADGVPLTVVSEEVDTGLKKMLHRRYHFLAVDLERL